MDKLNTMWWPNEVLAASHNWTSSGHIRGCCVAVARDDSLSRWCTSPNWTGFKKYYTLTYMFFYILTYNFYRRASNDNAGKTGFIGEASCFMSSRLLMLSSETDIFQSKTSCDIIARISFVATREPGHFRAP
jgi:hypothetical protein